MFSHLFDCRLNIPGLMLELGSLGWTGYQAVAAGEFPFLPQQSSPILLVEEYRYFALIGRDGS